MYRTGGWDGVDGSVGGHLPRTDGPDSNPCMNELTDSAPALPARIPAQDLPALLQRYQAGEHLKDLAAEYGVTGDALRKRFDRYCLAGKGDLTLHDVVTEYLVERLCTSMEQQEIAPDMLSVARTRDVANNWKWINERRRPKLYGPKQEVSVDEKITVIVQRHQPPQDIVIDVRSTQDKDEKVKEINGLNV